MRRRIKARLPVGSIRPRTADFLLQADGFSGAFPSSAGVDHDVDRQGRLDHRLAGNAMQAAYGAAFVAGTGFEPVTSGL
jgi:hypothetical protein